jgi:SRSO17 transposase
VNLEARYSKCPLEGHLSNFNEPIVIHKVDETLNEPLWDHLVREYHYLGYQNMLGRRVKYLITLGKRIVAAISFCSASYKLAPRDIFIGWDEKTRLKYLPRLINNNRFLILPWIRIHNLASHLLSLSLKKVRKDWSDLYGLEPCMAETFVDNEKYEGTCYKASNWIHLGVTKGFGRKGNSFVYHGRVKDIFVYVMSHNFMRLFQPSIDRLPNDEKKEIIKMINGIPFHHKKILDDMGVTNFDQEKFDELLSDHLHPYITHLERKEVVEHFLAAIKGRLSDLERKNVEQMSNAFLGVGNARNSNNFMSRSKIPTDVLYSVYHNQFREFMQDRNGMITGDGTDFSKKGSNSVGVARQHDGTRGKTDNCQASVMVGFVGDKGYGLYNASLYMPEVWMSPKYEAKRFKCRVPEDLKFETKNTLLLNLIKDMIEQGRFNGKYIGVDSSFGRDHNFLDSLPEGFIYFADVPCNLLVFPSRPEMVAPQYSGRGRIPGLKASISPVNVSDLAKNEDLPWQEVVLGTGSKGPIFAKDKCLRVVEVRNHNPGKDIWLYIRQLEDGSINYSLCNESPFATPDDIRKPALMRWSMEQCFRECKKYLGMDHYESRTWPAWRRHILFTFIAHLFICKLRNHFSIPISSMPIGPVVESPVTLEEFEDAVLKLMENQAIDHPKIKTNPTGPQQILTIGLVRIIVNSFLHKGEHVLKAVDCQLKQFYKSFECFSRKKVEDKLGIQLEPAH